ncbi:MAG: RusA family crossover junction endodeoxyribonuclease [Candidatus Bilamarchaeaceae archaeon]
MPNSINEFIIDGLPMPPSVNNTLTIGRQGRFIPSPEMVLWKSRCRIWLSKNRAIVTDLRKFVKDYPEPKYVWGLDAIFQFRYNEIFTTSRRSKSFCKRVDLNNRLKPLCDFVAEMMNLDDSLFFRHVLQKKEGKDSEVSVQIYPIPLFGQ